MIPEPQRCTLGTSHELLRIAIAYGLVLGVVAGARRHETHLRTELAFTTLLEMHGPGA